MPGDDPYVRIDELRKAMSLALEYIREKRWTIAAEQLAHALESDGSATVSDVKGDA